MQAPLPVNPRYWILSLAGLGLFVFALIALSGPGRIDIVDGQTRYEVGRSLLEHGDSVIRDERIWFARFPGRDGQIYTNYRVPQSLVASGAIILANLTGPATEGRQHFFFALSSALACSLLSIAYAVWFRHVGCRPAIAILWAVGGIVCTPNWFYGTSTFDEILGTAAIVVAVVIAYRSRNTNSLRGTVIAGLILAFAYHCKQPLGAFALLVLAAHDRADAPRRQRIVRAAVILAGVFAGIATEKLYDWYKFPFDKDVVHAELLKQYIPAYSNNPLPGLATLTVSPGAGAPWYCPPSFLMIAGLIAWKRAGARRLVCCFLIGCGVYIGFICMLTFFKGDPSWGPRYLTPLFALGWLFVPAGAQLLRRSIVALLLVLGLLVQVLALSVDPHRQYVKLGIPGGANSANPWMYFHPAMYQLFQRPREITEVATDTVQPEKFTPSPSPTFGFPVVDPGHFAEIGPDAVRRYRVLNSFRPWWIAQRYLRPDERPVDIGTTAVVFGLMAGCGLLLLIFGTRRSGAFNELAA
jgi:hypothetical protein